MACPNRLLPLEDPRQKVSPMCTRGMNFLTWAPSPSERKSFPRRKSCPMCTRGAHFLAAVRPRGSSLPRTPPRVYTRGGLSVIGPVSRQSDLPSLSENASRVYTRVAFSDAGPLGTLPTSSSGPLRSRRGNHWASGPALSRATSHHDPPSEPFPCGGRASRQSDTPVTEGPLAANSRYVRFRVASTATAAHRQRASPVGFPSERKQRQKTPDVSTHSGK